MIRFFSKPMLTISSIPLLVLLASACTPVVQTDYYDAIIIEEKLLPNATYEYTAVLPDNLNYKIVIKHNRKMPWEVGQKVSTNIPAVTIRP